MAAEKIITAGPFLGHIEPIELKKLSRKMHSLGCHWQRAHQHKQYIVLEGWKERPEDQGDLPSGEFLDALIAGETKH